MKRGMSSRVRMFFMDDRVTLSTIPSITQCNPVPSRLEMGEIHRCASSTNGNTIRVVHFKPSTIGGI